jgi:hypothetical protein
METGHYYSYSLSLQSGLIGFFSNLNPIEELVTIQACKIANRSLTLTGAPIEHDPVWIQSPTRVYVISHHLYMVDPNGWPSSVYCAGDLDMPVDDNASFIRSILTFRQSVRASLFHGAKAAQFPIHEAHLLKLPLNFYHEISDIGTDDHPRLRHELHGQITPNDLKRFQNAVGQFAQISLSPSLDRKISGAITMVYDFHLFVLNVYFNYVNVTIIE